MKLFLKRFVFGNTYTIGNLSIDGKQFCQILEDRVREKEGVPVSAWKVQNETAIPKGTYKVIIDHSEHFGKDMLHVLNVPGWEGVRIHGGNKSTDTEGCLIVGVYTMGKGDWIDNSQATLGKLFPIIYDALGRGELVEITVK